MLGKDTGHRLGEQDCPESELPSAAKGELASLADIPSHQLGNAFRVCGRWRHVIAPQQSGRGGDGVVIWQIA